MNSRPLVTAVIPTYNNAELVTDAVDSVLEQTWKEIEVIVVDDGSTDDTPRRLAEYGSRIRVIRQENLGPPVARNAGIKAGRGEFVAFLDSDDLWLPRKVELSVRPLLHDPKIGVVYTDFRVLELGTGKRYQVPSYRRGGWMARDLFRECRGVSTSSLVVRRTCFDKVGLFDEELFRAQDWDMIVRLAEQFRYHFVEDILLERRLHRASLSVRHADKYAPYNLKVIEKAAARRPDLYSPLRRDALARAHYRFGMAHYEAYGMRNARRQFLMSLGLRLNAASMNYLARTFLPVRCIAWLRALRLRRQLDAR